LSVPSDRAGTFDPKLIAKYQRRFPDFDDKIISMYACGMTVREIRGHLEELYGIEVSPDSSRLLPMLFWTRWLNGKAAPSISVTRWCSSMPSGSKSAMMGFVHNKAIYIALGVLPGPKEILGIWIEQTEGAKFWLRVVNELKTRGAQDILIAVVDGLKGFPEAINAVFPQTVVQTCIVHLIRIRWISHPGRIARTSRRHCGQSIARSTPPLARLPLRTSRKDLRAGSIRRPLRAGAATGSS
jgi:putative transposase